THGHRMNDGSLVHTIEFRIVDLIAVDHCRTGGRQAAGMPPAAPWPVPRHRGRRLDQLHDVWPIGAGEPDPDRIEDEDPRCTNGRLGQILKLGSTYVFGEKTDCIVHRRGSTSRPEYGLVSAQCRAISSRVAIHTSLRRST